MFCTTCGTTLLEYDQYCPSCGSPVRARPEPPKPPELLETSYGYTPPSAPAAPPLPDDPDADLRLFIGSQADLYLAKWRSDSHWNWAAFCFDGYWLLYRGMYLYFLLYVIFASVVVNVLGALFFKTIILERLLTGDNLITILCFYFLLKIIMGLIGNQLYLSHAKRKIASMYYRFPRDFEMREEKIAAAGETSLFVPIALAALPLLLAAVVALISAVIAFKSVVQYTPPGLIYGIFQRYI